MPERAPSRASLALAIAALLAGGSAAGAHPAGARVAEDLYVSTRGNDASDGRSPAGALATLKEALRRARPGTIIRVLPGTYAQTVRHVAVGAPGAPITIRGEGGRATFTGNRTERWGLWLEESAHVVIERLTFRDYTDMGLVVVLSEEITLRRLRVHDNGFDARIGWVEGYGMHLDESSGLLVERNRVFRNGPVPGPPRFVGTGINGYALRDSVIRRNRSHDNNGGGILVEDSYDVLVRGNRIYRNDLDVTADGWWDGGIWLDGGGNVRLVRNRIEDNIGPGIEVSDEDCQRPTGYLLKRNTSRGNLFGIYVWNFGSDELPPSEVLELVGNDFSGNSRRNVWVSAQELDCRR